MGVNPIDTDTLIDVKIIAMIFTQFFWMYRIGYYWRVKETISRKLLDDTNDLTFLLPFGIGNGIGM